MSDSKRKIKNDSQHNYIKSSSKKKLVNNTLKHAKNLYIKNPYATDFSSKNSDNVSTSIKSNNNFLFNSINFQK